MMRGGEKRNVTMPVFHRISRVTHTMHLQNDSISFIGGVVKAKYTTPHDFALR